jgi:FkbM family methyltransferase
MPDAPLFTVRVHRSTLFGLLTVVALAAAAIWYLGRVPRSSGPAAALAVPAPVQSSYEMEYFRKKYGPEHQTEREEEWMIRDYFNDRRGGVFVDVGANHYRATSKTYYLETKLGWSGIAVEPQREFAADYARHRPRTKLLPFFVSDSSNETARLHIIRNMSPVASSDEAFVRRFGKPDEVREVPTITLTDLLAAERVERIDFLTMDIELHEPRALRGFDIERFKPSLVCIEALLPVRQQILNYFAGHGYVLVGKYVWVDLENLYFAPADTIRTEP